MSNPPYGGDSHLSGNYNNYNSGDSSLSPHDSSSSNSSTDNNSNLPLLIGLPACVVLFIIIITVFLVQRNNHCNKNSSPPGGKPARPPVPVHERDAYYYSNCHPHQQTVVNPLLINSRDKLPKTPTPSVDLTSSEFSSVSRTHPPQQLHYYHHHHNNLNYGYWSKIINHQTYLYTQFCFELEFTFTIEANTNHIKDFECHCLFDWYNESVTKVIMKVAISVMSVIASEHSEGVNCSDELLPVFLSK